MNEESKAELGRVASETIGNAPDQTSGEFAADLAMYRFEQIDELLAVVQEEFLAEAHAKGFAGNETALYKLIIALRRAAVS